MRQVMTDAPGCWLPPATPIASFEVVALINRLQCRPETTDCTLHVCVAWPDQNPRTTLVPSVAGLLEMSTIEFLLNATALKSLMVPLGCTVLAGEE